MDIQGVLESVYHKLSRSTKGRIPRHLPQTRQDKDKFSITIITVPKADKPSKIYQVGDVDFRVSVQSTIKPIINSLVFDRIKVGESSTLAVSKGYNKQILSGRRMYLPFDVTHRDMLQSIYQNNPYTSIIAIQHTGLLVPEVFNKVVPYPKRLDTSWACIQRFLNKCRSTKQPLKLNRVIFEREKRVLSKRYRGDTYWQSYQGSFTLRDSIDLYSRQCSLMVSSKDCAELGFFLANCGVSKDGKRIITKENLQKVLSFLL